MSTMYPSKKAGFNRTVLWTNASPTSNYGTVTVTLSEAMTNFDYLEFVQSPEKSNDESTYKHFIVPVSEVLTTSNAKNHDYVTLGTHRWTYDYVREYTYVSDIQIKISSSYRVAGTNTSGNTETTNNIPIKIIGIKM